MESTAFALLSRGRSVLVELGLDHHLRFRGRIQSFETGHSLTITLLDSIAAFPPEVSGNANIVVPISHCSWCFPTSVLDEPDEDSPVVRLSWPDEAHQLDGRRSPRLEQSMRVRCRPLVDDRGFGPWIVTYTLDIANKGLRLAYPAPLERGHRVVIELELRGHIMTATGVVAWNKAIVDQSDDPLFSLGVQLDRISESARIRLRSIIQGGT